MTDDQRTEGRTDNWPQHKLTWSKAPGELMTKLTKSDKNKFKNHIQTMCTSTDLGENVLSFKKTSIKLYEKLQSEGTHCLYI